MKDYDYTTLCRDAAGEVPEYKCKVTGTIPDWLNGMVVFNGPGKLTIDKEKYLHTFDGLALMQKFEIKKGEILYTSKFLDSIIYKECLKEKKITRPSFATPGPPNKSSFLSRLATAASDSDKMYSDNANLAVVKLGNRLLAVAEVPIIFELDPNTFDVIDRVNLNDKFGIVIVCVHFHKVGDEYYTMGYTMNLFGAKYVILKFPSDGSIKNVEIVSSISPLYRFQPSYIHSIGLSENYALLIETPSFLVMKDLVRDIFTNTPFIHSFKWTNDKVHFQIIDRKTWKPLPQVYVSDPFFFMHIANCYEQDDNLILAVHSYRDSTLINSFYLDTLHKPREEIEKTVDESLFCTLKRFAIPLKFKEVGERNNICGTGCRAENNGKEIHLYSEEITNIAIDHPTINIKNYTKKNQFVFGNSFPDDGSNCGMIVKVDMDERKAFTFKELDRHSTTVVFVAKPGAEKEDEGVLLAHALNSHDKGLVELLIVNAEDMSLIAAGRVETSNVIPLPLHANFYPF